MKQEINVKVRLFIYEYFIENTFPPDVQIISDKLNIDTEKVQFSLKTLSDEHKIVLFRDSYKIWMAQPFNSVKTDFLVVCGGKKYWGA